MISLAIVKLQYEILNVSIADLASGLNIPPGILQAEADKNGWRQWWPNAKPIEMAKGPTGEVLDDPDEVLAVQAEQYMDSTRKRLSVYSLAKEVYLAQKYMNLEATLIDKAQEVVEGLDVDSPQAVKAMASLYKDMTSGSPMRALQAITMGEDDNGIPMVTIRDMSGS